VLHQSSARKKNSLGITSGRNPDLKHHKPHYSIKSRKGSARLKIKELNSIRKAFSKKKSLFSNKLTLKKRKMKDISSFQQFPLKAKLLKN